MEFTRRKLPHEEAEKLRSISIGEVQPFVPMPAPVYVFMRQNQKFVSVKAPLDFFTPDELERLQPFGEFYFDSFVDSVALFIRAARRVRAVLDWQPRTQALELAPASFEISDAVLRVIGPLWSSPGGMGALIEPYFTAIFACELCEPIAPERLRAGRERDIGGHERGLIHGGFVVFLALHLGYTRQEFLSRVFERVYGANALGEQAAIDNASDELSELIRFAGLALSGRELQPVIGSEWAGRGETVARKLVARLERVSNALIEQGAPAPTVYGERGFLDVAVA